MLSVSSLFMLPVLFQKVIFPHQTVTSEQHCYTEFQLSAYSRNYHFWPINAWNILPFFPWEAWEKTALLALHRLRATLTWQIATLSLGKIEGEGGLSKPNTLWKKIQSLSEGSCDTLGYQNTSKYEWQYSEKDISRHKQWLYWKSIESKNWDMGRRGRRNEIEP